MQAAQMPAEVERAEQPGHTPNKHSWSANLKRVHVAKAILHVRVHNELHEAKDLATEMKGVAESRLLPLLGCESLNGLEVEVVVEVEVVEVLAVDEKVEHVVALATDLEPRLHPVQTGRLEELGRLERPEEVPEGTCMGEGGGVRRGGEGRGGEGRGAIVTYICINCYTHSVRTDLLLSALGCLCLRALRT